MTGATLADFRDQFPEFNSSADDVVNRILAEALLIHSARPLATLFCAAHLLKYNEQVAAGSTPATETSMRKAGPLSSSSITQATDGWQAFFTSTPYGRRFLILEQRTARSGIGAMVVG